MDEISPAKTRTAYCTLLGVFSTSFRFCCQEKIENIALDAVSLGGIQKKRSVNARILWLVLVMVLIVRYS